MISNSVQPIPELLFDNQCSCLLILLDHVPHQLSFRTHALTVAVMKQQVLFLFLLYPVHIFAVPKCVLSADGSGGSPCSTVIEWKDNLLCRIQGPADETGARAGGYVADSIPKPEDDIATVKRKLWAQNLYARLTVVLNTNWVFQNQYGPLVTIAAYEQLVNRIGTLMYGVNWVVSPKPCGVGSKGIAMCGDKGRDLTPPPC